MTELPRLKQDLVDAAQRGSVTRRAVRSAPRRVLAGVLCLMLVAAVLIAVGTIEEPSDDVEVPASTAIPGAGDCRAPEAMLRAVPALEARRPTGGVPPAVKGALRKSRLAARDARLWGQADGVEYWVAPRLRCDEPPAIGADQVCIIPVRETDRTGIRACSTIDEWRAAGGFIHFPLSDRRAAIAGVAPANARYAMVRVARNPAQTFEVKGGVWGGTLDGAARGEVGGAVVAFDRDPGVEAADARDRAEVDGAVVAVLNATTNTGLGEALSRKLETRLDAKRGRLGSWTEQGEGDTVVLSVGDPAPAEVIGRHLAAPVRPADDQARKLAGSDADVIVVAGRDAAD